MSPRDCPPGLLGKLRKSAWSASLGQGVGLPSVSRFSVQVVSEWMRRVGETLRRERSRCEAPCTGGCLAYGWVRRQWVGVWAAEGVLPHSHMQSHPVTVTLLSRQVPARPPPPSIPLRSPLHPPPSTLHPFPPTSLLWLSVWTSDELQQEQGHLLRSLEHRVGRRAQGEWQLLGAPAGICVCSPGGGGLLDLEDSSRPREQGTRSLAWFPGWTYQREGHPGCPCPQMLWPTLT